MSSENAENVTVPRDSLMELRDALMAQIVWCPQDIVEQVNRAIGLADVLLGIDGVMADLRRAEDARKDRTQAADPC